MKQTKINAKKAIFSTVLATSLALSTFTPVKRVKAQTMVKIENEYNKEVDIELYKVLPIKEAINWSIQKYGKCHVVVKELPAHSGNFVYAINNGDYKQGWSSVPDENIYNFDYLNYRTGGYALTTDYYDYPLSEEYINSKLKEKEENERLEKERKQKEEEEKNKKEKEKQKEQEEKDLLQKRKEELKQKLGKVILNEIAFDQKDIALDFAYIIASHFNKGFCVMKRTIINPRNNKEVVMYAISNEFYLDGWEIVANDDVPENANIFVDIESAEYTELACISDDPKDAKKYKKIKYTK